MKNTKFTKTVVILFVIFVLNFTAMAQISEINDSINSADSLRISQVLDTAEAAPDSISDGKLKLSANVIVPKLQIIDTSSPESGADIPERFGNFLEDSKTKIDLPGVLSKNYSMNSINFDDFGNLAESDVFLHDLNLKDNERESNRFLFTDLQQTNFKFFKTGADESVFEAEISDLNMTADNKAGTADSNKFHWKSALIQSGIFLGIQNAGRMLEHKTRRRLDGHFFREWKESIQNLRGWDDGGKTFTNYIAHPLQGSITGRIFVNNSDLAQKQEFGKSKAYWKSRLKAMLWSAVWSTQFEIGPISEASLGNVGQYNKTGRSVMAWGDFVVTPTVGTGFLIAEDAIEKYFLRWTDKKVGNKYLAKFIRTIATPATSFANLLRAKPFWYRDIRPYENR